MTNHSTRATRESSQPAETGGPPVYLCQVSPDVSCGACCGLYNVADPSPEALENLLVRRTHWFAETPRTVAGIDAFASQVAGNESQRRPFPDFHHCPFLGMIEDDGRCVGCLLHPLARGNQGIDWRGLSYYGGMACRTYFCPSVKRLPARWLTALRQSMDHWYLHGLTITERRLLDVFFSELEKRIGRPIEAIDFSRHPAAAALRTAFTTLKLKWPFRRRGAPCVANYFFEDGLYPRPRVQRKSTSIRPSPVEGMLRELDSGFSRTSELRDAEATIDAQFLSLEVILTASSEALL